MIDEIIIREATDADMPFFFNSLLHHYKHSSPHTKLMADYDYYNDLHNIISRALERKGNRLSFVALKEEPDVVLGYVWANDCIQTIMYVYVKKAFRLMGIGKHLVSSVFPSMDHKIYYPFLTYDAGKLSQKYPNLFFNPYLLDAHIWKTYQNRFEENQEDLESIPSHARLT
jgi:hypothetical protein